MNWTEVRELFPAVREWTYLNAATMGHLPATAERAIADHVAHRNRLACGDFLSWYDDHDRVREKLGRLFHCPAEDVAFIPAACHALSLLIGGIDWQPGDRIVTLEDEFPNQIYYPALLTEQGVEFVETPWERFEEALSERTRLVVVSAMSYLNGFRPPLAELSRKLRQRGILFFVDSTQGAGALRYHLADLDLDLFACHCYKWMLAPSGIGFMVAPKRTRDWLKPNVIGWRSHEGWRKVDDLHHGAPRFADKAEKYEGAMLPALLIYALEASVDLMLELGAANIEQRVLALAARTRAIVASLGGTVVGAWESPTVAARFPNQDASALARALREEKIIVSARHGNLRISTHLFNNEADLDALERGLGRLLFA
ncbi:MAG: aminotransferase class V-fold PLP-dependent enzyme [Bryobacteraceae bacterium]|nr:aminotransferase class V-fold PLP-dependent enzyme [Bryobacteraceae bacterium]